MTADRRFERLSMALIAGTAIELASDRHWDSAVQLIPWVALVALVIALVLVTQGDGRWVRIGRILAVVVGLTALVGIFEHVHANVDAGFLDAHYGATWATRTTLSRWWVAASGGVGPSPLLAPGILALGAATVWSSARRRRPSPVPVRSDA